MLWLLLTSRLRLGICFGVCACKSIPRRLSILADLEQYRELFVVQWRPCWDHLDLHVCLHRHVSLNDEYG